MHGSNLGVERYNFIYCTDTILVMFGYKTKHLFGNGSQSLWNASPPPLQAHASGYETKFCTETKSRGHFSKFNLAYDHSSCFLWCTKKPPQCHQSLSILMHTVLNPRCLPSKPENCFQKGYTGSEKSKQMSTKPYRTWMMGDYDRVLLVMWQNPLQTFT